MNTYCNINDLKQTGGLNITGTASDDILITINQGVAREIDKHVNRNFFVVQETRYFDGNGKSKLPVPDLISIGSGSLTESTGMNGTWNKAWAAEGTAWIGWPWNANPKGNFNASPYRQIRVNEMSNNTDSISFEIGQRRFKIDGVWGYNFTTSSASSEVGIGTAAVGTSGTMAMVSGASFYPGDMVMLQFDNAGTVAEQAYVTDVNGTNLTLQRGVNGWSVVDWSTGTNFEVYRLQVPAPIRLAAIAQTGRIYKRAQSAFVQEMGIPEAGEVIPLIANGLDRDVKQLIKPYLKRKSI